MNKWMLVCLLGISAAAVAQTPAQTEKRGGKNSEIADLELGRADVAKRDAEEAKTRAKLDEARARLAKAAREVAELSGQLGREAMVGDERIRTIMVNGDRRAVLGVQIDNASDKTGARVLRVSPGVRPKKRACAMATSSCRWTANRSRAATTPAECWSIRCTE